MNLRRQPILTRAALVTLVSAFLMLLSAFGVPITDVQQEAVNRFVMVVAPFVLWWWSHRRTTPTSDPRDNEGNPLVREDWK